MEPICFNPSTDARPTGGFRGGDRVRVPAGTEVRSTHPNRKCWISARSQVVLINHELHGRFVPVDEALGEYKQTLIQQGYDLSKLDAWKRDNSPEYYRMMILIDAPTVRWAGAGGYWCEVPASVFERV
jgi:hypothetical protein